MTGELARLNCSPLNKPRHAAVRVIRRGFHILFISKMAKFMYLSAGAFLGFHARFSRSWFSHNVRLLAHLDAMRRDFPEQFAHCVLESKETSAAFPHLP